jgi:isoaspartyl peptidase/L-asparaginase-like protein (Ntn-hydrolase superfamily)
LCHEAVRLLHVGPQRAAEQAINNFHAATGGEAGLIMVDLRGRYGYAHNSQAMEIALLERENIRHIVLGPATKAEIGHPVMR